MQESKENTQASYTVSETPEAKETKNQTAESLKKLRGLETELEGLINKIADGPIKNTLKERITSDQKTIKEASNGALDPEFKESTMPEGSANLAEFQNKTQEFFKKELEKAVDQDLAREISQKLAAVHQARLETFKQSLRDKYSKNVNRAYQNCMYYMFPEGERSTLDNLDSSAQKNLLHELMNAPGHKIQTAKGAILETDSAGSSLYSDDPQLLGMAAGAAGFTRITLTGSPKNVLIAAKAALATGVVKEVNFPEALRQTLANSSAYKESFQEFLDAQEQIRAIDSINAANKIAYQSKSKTVFNDEPEKPGPVANAERFNDIPMSINPGSGKHPLPAHKIFLESLSLQERLELALQLKDTPYKNPFSKDNFQNPTISGYELIKRLNETLSVNPIDKSNARAFDEAAARVFAQSKTEEFKKLNTADDVLKYINEQPIPEFKKELIKTTLNQHPNKEIQSKVRAALMKDAVDEFFNDSKGFFGSKDPRKLTPSIDPLLSNITTESERDEVRRQFVAKVLTVTNNRGLSEKDKKYYETLAHAVIQRLNTLPVTKDIGDKKDVKETPKETGNLEISNYDPRPLKTKP